MTLSPNLNENKRRRRPFSTIFAGTVEKNNWELEILKNLDGIEKTREFPVPVPKCATLQLTVKQIYYDLRRVTREANKTSDYMLSVSRLQTN